MKFSMLLQLEDSSTLLPAVENIKKQMSHDCELFVLSPCPLDEKLIKEIQASLSASIITGDDCFAGLCTRAVALAQGDCIAFAKAEDLLAPEALGILINCLRAHPDASFVWAAHTVADSESEFLKQDFHVKAQPVFLPDLLAFGSPRCAVWRASLHREKTLFSPAYTEEPVYDFLLNAATQEQGLFYPAALAAVSPQRPMPANAQSMYYSRLKLYENYFNKLVTGALPIFSSGQSFQGQAQKLAEVIAQLNAGNPPTRQVLESLTLQCILGAWQMKNLKLARDLAMDIMPALMNSECIGLALRRIILNEALPGSVGKKKDDAPLVSVVTPLYNQGEYLSETVQSVLNQNYANWEMVIVNDGSTDDSLNVAQALLEKHSDPRIKLLDQQNRGKGYTRNRGVREAKGKYICVLDSDDEIAPDYLHIAVQLLESMPQKGWVTPKTLVFGPDHHITWDWMEDTEFAIPRSCSPCSAVYRRCIWEELGGYFEDMTDREDWEFWIRAWEAGWSSTSPTEELLFIYRHAFSRFGTKPQINLNSKLEVIKLHPWWFKPLPEVEVIKECFYHNVARFRDRFINLDYIAIAKQLHANKANFQKYMCWLKEHWCKLYQTEKTNLITNKLRMGLHYLAKKEKSKAFFYLAQLPITQLEDWQSQMLDSIEPLMKE